MNKKPSKKQLIKLLVDNGVSVSRTQRKDENELLKLITDNNLNISDLQNVPRGTIEENETPEQVEITENEQPENELDEREAAFARLESIPDETDEPIKTFNVDENVQTVNVKKPRKPREKKNGSPEFSTFQVEGYMLLLLVDLILPSGIAFVFNMFEKDKSKKIKASEITLNEKQREDITPIADAAAQSLSMKMNPLTAFFVMSSLSYAFNVFMLKESKNQ